MMHPAADVQKAIYEALIANGDLITLLGGTKIFDHHPERVAFPYIVLGQATSTDWSTSTEDGTEHLITVHIWSRRSGREEVYDIQRQVGVSLHDAQFSGQDHHIINLRFAFSETRRDANSGRLHGVMRFRAVTEPKP